MREIKFRAWDGKEYWYDVIPMFKNTSVEEQHQKF